MFTSKTPHFFKVILQDTIRVGVLGIPREFVRKYGNDLPNTVELEVPSGAIWKVELTKNNGRVRMQEGWREFAEHYSLEFGSFVVFRYEGNGHFGVLIFDRSASEIEYAHTRTEDDNDNVSAGRKRKMKSDSPCPLPQKKMRTGLKFEDSSSHISLDDPNSEKIELGNLKKNENSCGSKGQVAAGGEVNSACGSVKMEVLCCWQKLTDTEMAHSIQIANGFKRTENPVFLVFLRPSSFRYPYQMHIPLDFARKFLEGNKGNLTISNSVGKIWPMKYSTGAGNKTLHAQLYSGWQAFVEDNQLVVGDICAFELIKHPEILMKVSIYSLVKDAREACRPSSDKSIANRDRTRSLVNDTEPDCRQTPFPSSSKEFEVPKLNKQKKRMTFRYSAKELGGHNLPLNVFLTVMSHMSVANRVKTRRLVSNTEPNSAAYIASRSSSTLVSRKSKEKSHLPCPLPPKKMRTDSPIPAEQLNSEISVKPEALSCSQHLTATEKAHAVQIASAFKSTGNPICMVVMQRSFVSNKFVMGMPSDFAREFLTMQKCYVTLCNSAGKTWPAKYRRNADSKTLQPVLYCGWQAFVEDNHLGVGDMCVFELIKHPEILMKVTIYHVVENASKACSSLARGSMAKRVKTRSLVSDTEPTCQQSPCPSGSKKFKDPTDSYIEILDDSPLNQKTRKKLTSPCFQPCNVMRTNSSGSIQAKGIKLKKEKKSMNSQYIKKELWGELKYSAKDGSGRMSRCRRYLKPDLMGQNKIKPSTPTEKQGACIGASDFTTSNPSFSVVMRPAYVNSCTHLHIPWGFAERYLNNGEIILRVPDGRTWTVVCEIITANELRRARFHSSSWRPFVIGNELKVGDVCIFELTKDNGNLLEVVIHRKIEIS
ncbi:REPRODUCTIVE MERISTEM 39, REDUCED VERNALIZATION RESPONSE 1 [Hibiscus trionum]|uniref:REPRODUCTIVE MERISTEM 39, REDUCED VERNALIZATION RESPONSE 1 n=1 Tax=Hibiscus trionum TaxID=183268 RepID=A0A9W7H2W7_HIBTR|nr:REPRODUCTIVE MERISTEM 39, REDUCED VERNALIZATION RESPONSE 1 [Hibiscus trionum]